MSGVTNPSSSRSNATLSYYSTPSIPLLSQPPPHAFQRQLYIRCLEREVPCPEALGYTQGKTLGSGTYAKVKAAWSPFEKKMVRKTGKKKSELHEIATANSGRVGLVATPI